MYLYRAMQNPRQTDEQTAHSHDIIAATRDLSLCQVPRLILQPRYTANSLSGAVLAFVIRRTTSERATVIVASALVAHSGWHWMTERAAVLGEYRITRPAMDAMFLLGVLRGLLLLAISVGVAWGLSGVIKHLLRDRRDS